MTPPPDRPTVTVYDDGSWDSRRAVRAAALEAGRLGLDLAVVTAGEQPAADRTAVEAGWSVAALGVEARVIPLGSPSVDELLRRTRLLVVGRYGRGGRAALSPGSVTADLMARSAAPVLVVAHDPDDTSQRTRRPKVVVGLAGDADDPEVAAVALAAAERRGRPVVAVHAMTELADEHGDEGAAERRERLHAARGAVEHVCVAAASPGASVGLQVEAVGQDPYGAMRWHCGPNDLAVVGCHRGETEGPHAGGSLASRLLRAGVGDLLVVPLADHSA